MLGLSGTCPSGEAVAPPGLLPCSSAKGDRDGATEPPPALSVRNTFLEGPPQRSESLERFFEPRLARSMPPSAPGSGRLETATPRGSCRLEIATALDDDQTIPPFMINTPTESVREGMLLTPRAEAMTWPRTPEGRLTPRGEVMSWPCPATPTTLGKKLSQPRPPVLNLSEVILQGPQPKFESELRNPRDPLTASTSSVGSAAMTATNRPPLGSQVLPSRGSALHRYGACKPCAFVFREGCRGGVDCQFCHLCDPGERKARKKERLAMKREVREETRQQLQQQDVLMTGHPTKTVKVGGC